MAGWETKYTPLSNINGGNKYTVDSQVTIEMFIVPIENAEYAVQTSENAKTIAQNASNTANEAKNAVNSKQNAINESNKLDYAYLKNVPTKLPASDVYEWAKESTKPTYTASEVGAYSKTEIDAKFKYYMHNIQVVLSTTSSGSKYYVAFQVVSTRNTAYGISSLPSSFSGKSFACSGMYGNNAVYLITIGSTPTIYYGSNSSISLLISSVTDNIIEIK